ncbi:plastocyanin/azurin family copper-binding protein [Variovorax sp. J31P207]|uniref:plastocyanin/azurin family copper-binding protein n=1 Tax=Variovorax sp. J31P207 TaxID=3053510 RepID=UPI0025770813|nr:plastocyanin/azurin family copper-binding protein [Variovorax sp. J31P207]MDM0066646.1 plastocyanin/azurin family copper-binding protein [Variovorax sp. J31P207]
MFRPFLVEHRSALFVLVTCVALGAASAAIAAGAPTTVDVSKFTFGPKEITVAPGSTVRWINHDEVPHTVASVQGQEKVMASKAMDTDDRYDVTFSKEGDYAYYCTVHPFMTGVVHVHK